MERFNRRLIASLGELRTTEAIQGATALSLWDNRTDGVAAPTGVDFIPGQSSKVGTLGSFLSLLVQWHFDVILYGHVLLTPLMIIARLFSRRSRNVLIVHGIEVWSTPGPVRRCVVRRLTDSIFAVSAFTARRMADAYGLPRERFRLLPNAADVVRADDRVTSPPCDLLGQWRLLSVSRLSPADVYKNVDKVISALPSILASFPETHYYVVGDGSLRPSLERLAERMGVLAHVHFLGRVDDSIRDAMYRHCHVFVLPSTKEGFGIAFLEAWRFGLPVIASNKDAATEIIRHQEEGLCVDPRPAQIADAVCCLLADTQKRAEMGNAGHQRLLEHYTHERFRETLARLLTHQESCAA